jgi:hypothetical protein
MPILSALFLLACPDGEPEPDPSDFDSGCVYCHQNTDAASQEIVHPWYELSCSDCHGGNEANFDKVEAHASNTSAGGLSYRHLATEQLNRLDTDQLRFVNPGDLRVANMGCGANNPQSSGGMGCHQSIVDTTLLSVMTTFTGHYNVPRFLAGLQPREATVGVLDLQSTLSSPQEGKVASITTLKGATSQSSDVGYVLDTYLVQACPKCHMMAAGPNNAFGNYRSSGCTACHMPYQNDGVSQSEFKNLTDAKNSQGTTPHPARHVLTSAIPTDQCVHCHYQGARVGLMYQGIREAGGFKKRDSEGFPSQEQASRPANAEYLGHTMFVKGRADDYYVKSEDDDHNGVEDTPADLHHVAGMVCADCHIGSDVHGDGNLYSTGKFQVKIRCESCHGTVRASIRENTNSSGQFVNSAGEAIKALHERDGKIWLRGKLSGKDHVVKQVQESVENNPSWTRLQQAMGVNSQGYRHTDDIECHTCHSGWRQNCFGCHVEVGKGYRGYNLQTGGEDEGRFGGGRFFTSVDDIFLGTNHRGKISTVCPSEQMFITLFDRTSGTKVKVLNKVARRTASGKLGFGWQPNHPHTTQLIAQPCTLCHLKEDGSNLAEVKGRYGFGTGKFMMKDGEGTAYDLSQILDASGMPIVDFAHSGTGPVSPEKRQAAMDIRVP